MPNNNATRDAISIINPLQKPLYKAHIKGIPSKISMKGICDITWFRV